MQLSQFAKSYTAAAIATATPGQLVLMLFDGALRSMAIALNSFDEPNLIRRHELIHNRLVNAHDIILELQTSLDMKVPGEFSQRMWALYDFMMNQLRQANLRKDPAPIRVVEGLLKTIRDAWAEMLERTVSQAA
jgi:flagellar secretion chaperone FliS